MPSKETCENIAWIEERLKQIDKTIEALQDACCDYLQWMAASGYSHATLVHHRGELEAFAKFIKQKRSTWDQIFTMDTARAFQKIRGTAYVSAVRGLARYLFEHNRIARPIESKRPQLPQEYEDYILYVQKIRQVSSSQLSQIRRVLSAFDDYMNVSGIALACLKIEHVDSFLASSLRDFSFGTGKTYRSCLRGFLSYLYHERNMIRRDLAQLVIGARLYGRSKPPKFLRPQQVDRLLSSLQLSSAHQIRTYAMVYLACYLGLRPKEISMIRLDDISFAKAELTLTGRKNTIPARLPLPECVIMAVAAYIIGARPKTDHRHLFLTSVPPYRPVSSGTVGSAIRKCMRQAGLNTSAYWLRHTHAQNLLESGGSIFEVKEMMGHNTVESSKKYLHIHTKLMRQVLFNETL
jgi:site-specific recombinase XerD